MLNAYIAIANGVSSFISVVLPGKLTVRAVASPLLVVLLRSFVKLTNDTTEQLLAQRIPTMARTAKLLLGDDARQIERLKSWQAADVLRYLEQLYDLHTHRVRADLDPAEVDRLAGLLLAVITRDERAWRSSVRFIQGTAAERAHLRGLLENLSSAPVQPQLDLEAIVSEARYVARASVFWSPQFW